MRPLPLLIIVAGVVASVWAVFLSDRPFYTEDHTYYAKGFASDYPPNVAAYNAEHPENLTADGKIKHESRVIEDAGNWFCADESSKSGPLLICETRSHVPRLELTAVNALYALHIDAWFTESWGADKGNWRWRELVFSNGHHLSLDTPMITKERMPAFIHAFTASSGVTLVATNGRQYTIPLAGSSAVISTISIWAKEHVVPLPPPFTPPEQAILEPDSTISLRIPETWQLPPGSLALDVLQKNGAPVSAAPQEGN